MTPKTKTTSFIFSTIKYYENLIFNTVHTQEKAIRLGYYLLLLEKTQHEIDKILMTNKDKEIYKLLNKIDKAKKEGSFSMNKLIEETNK